VEYCDIKNAITFTIIIPLIYSEYLKGWGILKYVVIGLCKLFFFHTDIGIKCYIFPLYAMSKIS